MTKIRDLLEDAHRHLETALEHHDDGNYRAARYRVTQARVAISDALGLAVTSPAAVQGAQVSDGHSPRSVSGRERAARGMMRGTAAIRSESGGSGGITTVIASTNQLARDGWVVQPAGLRTENFLKSAAVLFNHNYEQPVATPVAARLLDGGNALAVDIQWPPTGISERADEVRGLVKSGVIRAVSIGFMPIETEPLNPKEPWGGQRVLTADLLELSFVGVPADTGAVVTQRGSRRGAPGGVPDAAKPVPVGSMSGPELAQHYREQRQARIFAFYGIRRRD